MPHDIISGHAKCPFFKCTKNTGKQLRCSIYYNDADLVDVEAIQNFKNTKELKNFAMKYCCTNNYFQCKIAATNFGFYEQMKRNPKLVKVCVGRKQVNKW